ncbi:MAG: hypothetical protein ACUVRL_05780 [Candidatus Saccharicenans sp.]|uniref:hypothetical protein n=1 Tax=Candidatus Saccharicenans sp. TaxID=2819258 RepID=UPI00404AD2A6
MLGKIDGEVLFKLEKLVFVSWFLRDWQIRVNGEPKDFDRQEIFAGLHQLGLEPLLKPGLNSIEVIARDGRGQVRKLIKNIYYADSGRIKVGDEFIFRYACKNSKSLTTRLKLEGRVIELESEQEPFSAGRRGLVFQLVDNGFLYYQFDCSAKLRATEPGRTILKVIDQFWDGGQTLMDEIVLLVE